MRTLSIFGFLGRVRSRRSQFISKPRLLDGRSPSVKASSNFHHRRGEIDLIMREKSCIVFVEVRYRSDPRFGGGLASVDRKKQGKLIATALYYLQTHAEAAKQTARFDVISIEPGMPEPAITWVRDAFRA